jgi:hypothetical protein
MEILMKFSPITWIAEVVNQELGDLIEFPKIGASLKNMSADITNLIADEAANIFRLVQDFSNKVTEVMKDRSAASKIAFEFVQNAFWTLWDGVWRCLVAIWDMLTHAMEGIFELAMGTWKIPFVTTLFTKIAKQPFSMVNVATFALAAILNISFQATTGKLPFETLPDPLSMFDGWTKDSVNLKPLFGLSQPDDDLAKFGVSAGSVKAENVKSKEAKVSSFPESLLLEPKLTTINR